MTEIQNLDSGKKFDADKIVALSPAGLLWRRHAIITVVKYSDDLSEPQTIALDFEHNTKYAQPILDRRMRKDRNLPTHDDNKGTISIAGEISKLAKLKEQGAITEEEFSHMKSNLMKKCSGQVNVIDKVQSEYYFYGCIFMQEMW